MFVKEIDMYVDYFEKQVKICDYSHREVKTLKEFKKKFRKRHEPMSKYSPKTAI